MPGEDEPVRITLRDVYNAVNETNKTVADLSKKFELQALAALQDTATVKDHEIRIRFLERWAWSIPAAAITAIAGVVIALIK
jgi:hypothetical protein